MYHSCHFKTMGGGEVVVENIGDGFRLFHGQVFTHLAAQGGWEYGVNTYFGKYSELCGTYLSDRGTLLEGATRADGTLCTALSRGTMYLLGELRLMGIRPANVLWQGAPRPSPASAGRGKHILRLLRSAGMGHLATTNLVFSDVGALQLQQMGVPASRIRKVPQVLQEGFNHELRGKVNKTEVLGCEPDTLVVLVNARVCSMKGLWDWLPEVMTSLEKMLTSSGKDGASLPKVQINLIGNDPKTEESASILHNLQTLSDACTRVGFSYLGFLPAQQVSMLSQVHDLLLHPSPTEGYSLALLEALACGLPPVVRSQCDSNSEIVTQSGSGISVANPAEAAQFLLRCVEYPEDLEIMRTNGYRFIKNSTGTENLVHAIYESTL